MNATAASSAQATTHHERQAVTVRGRAGTDTRSTTLRLPDSSHVMRASSSESGLTTASSPSLTAMVLLCMGVCTLGCVTVTTSESERLLPPRSKALTTAV